MLQHNYRETNLAADCTAKLGGKMAMEAHCFEEPPDEAARWMEYDTCGRFRSRSVLV